MASKVVYKASVERDLKTLDQPTSRRILQRLEQALATNPHAGTPLTGEFHGLFRYRVGEYRVIYAKVPDGVLVLRIAHRREAYR